MKWRISLIIGLLILIVAFLYKEYGGHGIDSQIEEGETATPVKENQKQDEKPVVNQAAEGEIGIAVGQQAPDIQLTTLEGESFQLKDYRDKKVILNFWATWCPPCKAEMPDMQTFYENHQNEDVEIIAVNLTTAEKKRETIQNFIDDYQISFTVPLDQTGVAAEQFEVYSIPASYLIDTQGIIRQRVIGPMSYEWMVDEVKKLP